MAKASEADLKRAREFGERLTRAMALRELGTNELGRLINVSGGQVSRYSNGKRSRLDEDFAWVCAEALNVNYLWLVGRRPEADMLAPNGASRAAEELAYTFELANLGEAAKKEGVFGPEIVERVRRRAERNEVSLSSRDVNHWRSELWRELKRAVVAHEQEDVVLVSEEPKRAAG